MSLNKIQNQLLKLLKKEESDQGLDREEKVSKLSWILNLVQALDFDPYQERQSLNLKLYQQQMIRQLEEVMCLFHVGEPDPESQERMIKILKDTLRVIKGLDIHLALVALDPEDEIPEWIDECLEPWSDPDTGEVYTSSYSELEEAVVQGLKSHGYVDTSTLKPFEQVSTRATTLLEQVLTSAQVDLGDGLMAFLNREEGIKTELATMQQAFQHYFEPTHQQRTESIAKAAESFYQAKVTHQSTTGDLTAGELVIAASESLRMAWLLDVPPAEYEEKLDWYGIPLALRRKPSEKNAGNLIIKNLAQYGWRADDKGRSNIMDHFDEIKAYASKNKMALVMVEYGYRPYEVTLQHLNLPNTKKGKDLLQKFQQNIFLIFCAEIFRYFPIEGDEASPVKQMPFAFALALGLEGLILGHLEFSDLFDHDARFGLPTGSRILDSQGSLHRKTQAVLTQYQKVLDSCDGGAKRFHDYFPKGHIASDIQSDLNLLCQTFGDNLKIEKQHFKA